MSLTFEARKKTILETLEKDEIVKVRTLAESLYVSGETIRRDLDKLEKNGLLKKVYGGAVKAKLTTELTFDQKTTLNKQEKRAISKAAADLVEDGDSILIGHGTTTLDIVRFLNGKNNVKVITASVPVLLLAMEMFHGQIIFLGGEVERHQKFTSGSLSEMSLGQLKVNKAFIAAGGVSIKDGITDYDLHGSSMSRKMIKRVNEAIILADHTKFGKTTFAHICALTDISVIVTSEKCSEEWKSTLIEKEIELLVAEIF
ncbi:DeoR/GlpR family DNA-binding transcription regulator [Pseudogracilibacillus auburnensis]|uniref:DeoR family transcriptional regulator n=1 Tax=Pseudogracilibacillus auburnensis TaxID=1494959 RepID=A0A2V3W8A5_9BACI|nr:DeoR/GlpR family DNA-binding transcription regulator [Pseudogracilibacillus auburnensis]PXW89418.1 DeoR family transcriptional regulator [Pseudogracilibacillus auburnensis]